MQLTRYRFGEFVLDPAARELRRHGERVALPLKSLECVVYLVAHRQRAVGRDELVSAVWGRVDVSDTVITQTLRRARKALDDAGDRQAMIRTVAGFGYRWVAEVSEESELEPAAATEPLPSSEWAESATPPAPEPVSAPVSRAGGRGWLFAVCAAVLLLVFVMVGDRYVHHARLKQETAAIDNRVTVLPVRVEPEGAELSWVRLGAMEYAAERLRSARLQVTPTEQALHLEAVLRADAAPPGADLAALRDLRVRSDARWLIVPTARQVGRQWRVQLRTVGRDDEMSVEATGDTPLQAIAIATDTWLHRSGRKVPVQAPPTAVQEHLRRIDAELDAGQLAAARTQIRSAPAALRESPALRVREGQLEYRAGHMDAAARLFQQALQDPTPQSGGVRAKGLMGLGAVALREGQPALAQRYYTEAMQAAKASASVDDVSLLGNAYNGRGVAHVQLGQLDAAVADLGQARMAMRRNGDVVSAAMVGSNLGRLEAGRNHWPQALQEFDSAIEVFRRYQVHDYMAATLAAKAGAELAVVQPASAAVTLARSAPLLPALEDARLLAVVQITQVDVALANGQLARAAQVLKTLSTSGMSDQTRVRLQMAEAVARGDTRAAAQYAAVLPDLAETLEDATVVVAVQAAGGVAAAQRWVTRWQAQQPPGETVLAPDPAFFEAVVQARFGEPAVALAAADRALSVANRDGSANDQVRAGLLRARVLMKADRLEEAGAVLGELDPYTRADYRVAWQAWNLHRRRGDAALTGAAQQQARTLAGERALEVVPLL